MREFQWFIVQGSSRVKHIYDMVTRDLQQFYCAIHFKNICRALVQINIVSHKLYLLSRIRRYLTKNACITVFKTMVLSIMEYGDIIYAGTSKRNLDKKDKLFYRGLRICDASNLVLSKNQLCKECNIVPLDKRRDVHALIVHYRFSSECIVSLI